MHSLHFIFHFQEIQKKQISCLFMFNVHANCLLKNQQNWLHKTQHSVHSVELFFGRPYNKFNTFSLQFSNPHIFQRRIHYFGFSIGRNWKKKKIKTVFAWKSRLFDTICYSFFVFRLFIYLHLYYRRSRDPKWSYVIWTNVQCSVLYSVLDLSWFNSQFYIHFASYCSLSVGQSERSVCRMAGGTSNNRKGKISATKPIK